MDSTSDSSSSSPKADENTPAFRRVVINSPDRDEESSNDTQTQPTSLEDGETAVSSSLANDSAGQPRQRSRFVSKHRKALDHIRVDATEARRYPVPYTDKDDKHSENNDIDGETVNSKAHQGPVDSSDWFNQSVMIKNRCDKFLSKHCEKYSKRKCGEWMDTFLPMCEWLRTYNFKTTLHKDVIAGLSVGVMIVPQSMSYAKLAGLPVQFGLYSALMPVFAYALFGSSRQLAIGPVALISLLLATGIESILDARNVTEETPNYTEIYASLAVQISFLVGICNIAMGILRLGFVTIFLSHAVISGFTTGAAVIIGMSQFKYFLGYDVAKGNLHEMLHNIFANIDQFNWKTFLFGSLAVGMLLFMKRLGKAYAKLKILRALGPLVVTVLSIVLAVVLDLSNRGIPIVDFIPSGLPNVTVEYWFPVENGDRVFMVTISIVIVGFMESIAIAKTLASKHKYEIDSSRELIGLGMANFVGSVFQSYPVTGSFSRSAVNHDSGAESGISAMVTASLVGLVLLFLTPVFEQLPLCVLAAIVISGVIGLLDIDEARHLWKVHKFDFAVWCTACFGTMFLGVETGLAIAVGVSLLIVIYESAYPHTAVLGRLPGTNVYRNIKQYPEAERYDGIVMVRIDAPLYFANMQNVRDKVRKYRFQAESELHANHSFEGHLKYLILELASVSHVDTSALHILKDMYETYMERGQQMVFVNPSLLVMQRFNDSGFVDLVGRESFFACLHDALNWCLEDMDQEATSVHFSAAGESDNDELSDEDPPKRVPVVELVVDEV